MARAFVVTAALALFVTPLFARPSFFTDTDLGTWGRDWLKFSDCIRHGASACVTAGLSKFPPAYLLNSYYVSVTDARGIDRHVALGVLNSLFLALPIAFIALIKGVRASLSRSLVYVVAIVLTAVPPFYVYSGALEVQSGVLIGIFISCLVLMNDDVRHPRRTVLAVLLFLTALLLPLYKDTNVLVVCAGLAVAGIQAWLRKRNHSTDATPTRPRLRQTATLLLIALTAGLAISMTYNVIKYGSVLPVAYLNEASQTSPPPARILEFFAATYFSPNGGVIVFWACALFATVWLLRGFDLVVSRAGVSLSVAVVLIYSVVLSGWWAPFGWDAWGDRLMLPVMLALVICLTATASRRSGEPREATPGYGVRRVIRNGALAAVVLVSLHFTFVSYYADKEAAINASLFSGPACQQMTQDIKVRKPVMGLTFWRTGSYYACAWERFIHIPRYIANEPRQ